MELNYHVGEKVNLPGTMALSVLKEIYPYNAVTGRALYQVKDNITGLFFALKCFDLKLNPEKDIRTEMVALNKLNDPNLFPRVVRFANAGQIAWLLLDWMNGTTLEDAYAGACQDSFEFNIRLTALKETCGTVARIHAQHLLHRDLKASNVVVKNAKAPASGAAIIDFGLAALRRQTIEGTAGYQPPEQEGVRNFNLGAQADVFSLGQIGWRLMTGATRMAFPDSAYAAWDEPLPELRALTPSAPDRLSQILCRAMAFKPGSRYTSAGQMLADLKGIRA